MTPTDLLLPTLTSLFDSRTEGVIYFRAVRDDASQVIDFSVAYSNPAIHALTQNRYPVSPGMSLRHSLQQIMPFHERLFADMCHVFETGQPLDVDHPYPDQQQRFCVNQSKTDDGILCLFRVDRNYIRQNQDGADLQAVIDNAQTGIFVISPVIDDQGQHVDFRFETINRMVTALVGQTPETVRGSVVSDWFTNYRQTGLFDRYKHTWETGENQHFTIHYDVDGFDVWFDVKAIKLGQEVMVTFSDISAIKQGQQTVEQAAAELRAVIDSAQAAIALMRPVYNSAGELIDFRFRMANQMLASYVHQEPATLIGGLKVPGFRRIAPTVYSSGISAFIPPVRPSISVYTIRRIASTPGSM